MIKLAASILLLGLFSTSQAEDTYYDYVPIQNLVPISYNPLTTNYNPDYDNYTWQTPVQRVQLVSSSPVSQDKAKLNQLDSQYRDRISNMGNGGFFDLLRDAASANQDRQMMNCIDPAEPAQLTRLKHTLGRGFSYQGPDVGACDCRN